MPRARHYYNNSLGPLPQYEKFVKVLRYVTSLYRCCSRGVTGRFYLYEFTLLAVEKLVDSSQPDVIVSYP
jgi:hypothetical protein